MRMEKRDNEIIKALECCTGQHGKNACAVCPFDQTDSCMRHEELALDLIKRQKLKIESLEVSFESMRSVAKAYQSAHARAEGKRKTAVQDFAERLEERAFTMTNGFEANEDCVVKLVAVSEIHNLVNEMTGAQR